MLHIAYSNNSRHINGDRSNNSPMERFSMIIHVLCAYDQEAGVWYVEKSDVPGLHVEARTQDDMLDELRRMVPELVRLNRELIEDDGDMNVPIELLYEHREQLPATG